MERHVTQSNWRKPVPIIFKPVHPSRNKHSFRKSESSGSGILSRAAHRRNLHRTIPSNSRCQRQRLLLVGQLSFVLGGTAIPLYSKQPKPQFRTVFQREPHNNRCKSCQLSGITWR